MSPLLHKRDLSTVRRIFRTNALKFFFCRAITLTPNSIFPFYLHTSSVKWHSLKFWLQWKCSKWNRKKRLLNVVLLVSSCKILVNPSSFLLSDMKLVCKSILGLTQICKMRVCAILWSYFLILRFVLGINSINIICFMSSSV